MSLLRRPLALALTGLLAMGAFSAGLRAFDAGGAEPGRAAAAPAPASRRVQLIPASLAGPAPVVLGGLASDGLYPQPSRITVLGLASDSARRTLGGGTRSAEGLRVWSHGDSTSYFMTVALLQMVKEMGAVQVQAGPDYKISSGLVNRGYFDWQSFIAAEMALHNPDVVVFMVGANDAAWGFSQEVYRERVAAVMDAAYAPGRTLVWVGQPNMGPSRGDLRAGLPGINAAFQAEAALRPWVVYADTWAVTSDAAGAYAQVLPDENGEPRVMRTDDDVHFTPAGGRLLARAVVAALLAPRPEEKPPVRGLRSD